MFNPEGSLSCFSIWSLIWWNCYRFYGSTILGVYFCGLEEREKERTFLFPLSKWLIKLFEVLGQFTKQPLQLYELKQIMFRSEKD